MKNYYKILGVKETATEEEIREKWVRLMRKLHPDQRTEKVGEDKKVKEVNEAYQILKFSSTRTQYDLKRAYEHKKRRSYARRLSIPISILIILLIMGTVYLKNSTNPINLLNETNGMNVLNVPNELNDRNELSDLNGQNVPNDLNGQNVPNDLNGIRIDASSHARINKKTSTNLKNSINPINDTNVPNASHMEALTDSHIAASTHDRIHTSTPPRINKSPLRRENSSTHLRISAKAQSPNDSITQRPNDLNVPNEINQTNPIDERDQINQTNQPNELNGLNVPKDLNDPDVIRIAASTHQRLDASTHELVAVAAFPAMIATEQEIKQFFVNYTERYIHKDLNNFLSLFSAKAVQNRQYGLERIRKIYSDFFNQSKEIKYFLEETRVEFYQNGLEVKARYELVQTLKRGDKQKIWRGDIRWMLVREQGGLKILSLDYQHQKSL